MITNDAGHILEELSLVPDVLEDREGELSSLKTKTLKSSQLTNTMTEVVVRRNSMAGKDKGWFTNSTGRTEFI